MPDAYQQQQTYDGSNNMLDLTSVPFTEFLRDVLYANTPDPSKLVGAQGLAVMDFCGDGNLEMSDMDFGLLEDWNIDSMAESSMTPQVTPKADDPVDLAHLRRGLVKIWTESPWRWHPDKLDSAYKEQSNLPVPSRDASNPQLAETKNRLDRPIKDKLDQSGRDRVLAVVLKTCQNNALLNRVASSFPTVEVMNTLVHLFLASHFCQRSQYIHSPSFKLNMQWPEWLAVSAAAGAILTPVQSLRKFGFALQEAVRKYTSYYE
jgi:hypothetical protein